MSKFMPNFSQIPNAFIDEVMHKLPDASVKMYLLIVRKTKGWNKEVDAISISQFMKFTGKSRPTVVDAIKYLVEAKIVTEHQSTRFGKTYSINDEIYEGFFLLLPSKKILLVKNFNQSSKKILLPLVKNFNPQKKLSKEINQNKKGDAKNSKLNGKSIEQFSFANELKKLGADNQMINDWMLVRKNKKASNSETSFKNFMTQVEKSKLPLNTILEICIVRDWKGFNASWLSNINLSEYQSQQANVPEHFTAIEGDW